MTPKRKKTAIIDKDNPILRQVSKHVPIKDIGSKTIKTILNKMSKALHGEEDGVAIAAPQIGADLRIFIVNSQAISVLERGKGKGTKNPEMKEDLVFINPEIIKLSKKKRMMEEGCLSVRWLYGKVSRSEKATVRAYDEKGKKFQIGGSGLLAQIFQHEIDHLDGILFIDKAEDLEDIPPYDAKKI